MRAGEIAIVDQNEVQFTVVVGREEGALIAEVAEEVAVAVDVRMQALKLADQRPFRLFVFGIELADLGMQQIAEE